MPNPYMSSGASAAERADSLEQRKLGQFLARLRSLGAEESTIDVVRDEWLSELDDDDRADREKMIAADDETLLRAIRDVESEYDHATTTEAEELERDLEAVARLRADAAAWVESTVTEVLETVGADRVRAAAALAAEEAGRGRVTLVEPLTELAGELRDDGRELDAGDDE